MVEWVSGGKSTLCHPVLLCDMLVGSMSRSHTARFFGIPQQNLPFRLRNYCVTELLLLWYSNNNIYFFHNAKGSWQIDESIPIFPIMMGVVLKHAKESCSTLTA